MRVLVYEHLTARGIGREPGSKGHGMYIEGRAIRDAVVEDFRRIPGLEVVGFTDADVPVDPAAFADVADSVDWTLVIAPEGEETLLRLADEVWPTSSRFLGPSREAIRLTSDKLRLADHWYDHDVATPATTDREPAPREAFPMVWKPLDGAGSVATFQLNTPADVAQAKAQRDVENHTGPMILQEYVGGQPASVAFLCGPAGYTPLVPGWQILSSDGRFKYLGGELPLAPELTKRALALAKRAVDCIPGLNGFIGADLVLGGAADGSRDYAIEINPRLTTSYLGLRALADFNLAEAILLAALGKLDAPLRWRSGRVRFGPDGTLSPG